MRRLWPTGPPFAQRSQEAIFDQAKARLLNPTHRLRREYCQAHGLPLLGDNLSALSADDLVDWKMEELIETAAVELEIELEELQYFDVFPEEDPDDFETILDGIVEQMRKRDDDVDWESAYHEANVIYTQRTGIVREP